MIHAGLYYGHGSLKTKLCLRGKQLIYELCAKEHIPHKKTQKWIIAQNHQQMDGLYKIHDFAQTEGVPTRFITQAEAKQKEPDVRADAGILVSESTGILDSHSFMQFLEGDFQERGGVCAFHSPVTMIQALDSGKAGYKIHIRNDRGEEESIVAESLVNSAGLFACTINNLVLPKERHRTPFYAKGSYYSYAASHPKPKTLLYPAPVPGHGGLGTHLTLDMAGRVRFGPDVEYVEDPNDLAPNPARLDEAVEMIKTYLPGIKAEAIDLDYSGIRPKVGKNSAVSGQGFQDFIIQEEDGFPGFINLLAIESPGLTSSLAIGELVNDLLYKGGHTLPPEASMDELLDFQNGSAP